MRHAATAALLTATLALAGCSGKSGEADAKPKAKTTTPTPSATPEKLEPIWGPKLKAANGDDDEGTSACQMPSSNACARYVRDIMEVVTGLEDAIEKSGRDYPKAQEQITKMKAAQAEYVANGCQGDVTADDPNSQCWGVAGITIGTITLDMSLLTDEVGM
ncbi:hypothetical protein ABZ490_51430 [Streptomyces sp. NPDC005811]|uniref:hypothetical protein n=1 Tax=Streptomyces sp. NPDC005811 TaxID=3154565 RepID=UPI0033E696FB